MTAGTYQSPATAPGDTLNFINGNVASAFPNLINLYNAKKDANGNWDVFVPVYQSPDCTPPNGAIPIIGYAEARITQRSRRTEFHNRRRLSCAISSRGIPAAVGRRMGRSFQRFQVSSNNSYNGGE